MEKENQSIECEACGAKSDKTPIMTYAGHSECWNCLAMAGLSRLRDNTYTAEEAERIIKRMEEGAHAVNTGAHEGMPREEK